MNKQNDLVRWASSQIGKKYEWGAIDCVSLALQGLRVMYGEDLFKKLQTWKDEKTALRAYAGYGSVHKVLTDNGWQEIHQNFARTGDVILLETSPLQTAAIVVNGTCLLIDPETGVHARQISTIKERIICLRKGKELCLPQ